MSHNYKVNTEWSKWLLTINEHFTEVYKNIYYLCILWTNCNITFCVNLTKLQLSFPELPSLCVSRLKLIKTEISAWLGKLEESSSYCTWNVGMCKSNERMTQKCTQPFLLLAPPPALFLFSYRKAMPPAGTKATAVPWAALAVRHHGPVPCSLIVGHTSATEELVSGFYRVTQQPALDHFFP